MPGEPGRPISCPRRSRWAAVDSGRQEVLQLIRHEIPGTLRLRGELERPGRVIGRKDGDRARRDSDFPSATCELAQAGGTRVGVAAEQLATGQPTEIDHDTWRDDLELVLQPPGARGDLLRRGNDVAAGVLPTGNARIHVDVV